MIGDGIMKRILLLFGRSDANMTVMAGMSTSKVRKETRFFTDKMAYELSLSTQQRVMMRMRLITTLFILSVI